MPHLCGNAFLGGLFRYPSQLFGLIVELADYYFLVLIIEPQGEIANCTQDMLTGAFVVGRSIKTVTVKSMKGAVAEEMKVRK